MDSLLNKRVWVAGHRGLVGKALCRRLERENCTILTTTRHELNLLNQHDVEAWLLHEKPDAVFIAAAKVGGIWANNTKPAEFLYENMMIAGNIIHAAHLAKVSKLMFLGSTCVYPKMAAQPITETALLTGALEPTNEWYAIAKIAGIKMCQAYRRQYGDDFISVMPTNLYGTHDNFDLESSHVIPALMRKAHEAKMSGAKAMTVWGSGKPLREFLHVDDLADACVFVFQRYSGEEIVNIGTGQDVSIGDLATMIARDVVGYTGALDFDSSKPDGTPRKVSDVSRLKALGWKPSIDLLTGLRATYAWFQENYDTARAVA
ncbi:MAG: GDP-L-fucose synthase [Alphaproteobacteria bacterium]|jgi:GDP-L-fucose synthase|nr:GDP-L-fucose synthase [Alphaproteobacteria bacterium]